MLFIPTWIHCIRCDVEILQVSMKLGIEQNSCKLGIDVESVIISDAFGVFGKFIKIKFLSPPGKLT